MFKKLFGLGNKTAKVENPDAVRLGIDLEMNYCPDCGDEYRLDIKQCVSCKVPLITGAEKLAKMKNKEQAFYSRSMDISASDQLITIRNGKLRDLKPYQILLAKDRIPALITGETGGCAKG